MFPSAGPPDVTDAPVYWFVKLELAVLSGDLVAAAEAQRQLERLGVVVRYALPTLPQQPRLYEVPLVR